MSIIFDELIKNVEGQLPVVLGPPSGSVIGSQGLIVDDEGSVWVSLVGAIDHYNAGLPFTALSELCVSTDPVDNYDQGLPYSAAGRLCVAASSGTDYYNQGVGLDIIGSLNTISAIPPTFPDQVQNLVVTSPVAEQIHAEWDAVTSLPAATSYTVEYKENSSGTWIPINVGLSLTTDILGLTSGVLYDVRVYATNINGNGPYSSVQMIVVSGLPVLPPQVQNLVLSVPVDSEIRCNWDAVVVVPAVTSYTVEYKETSSGTWIDTNVGLVLQFDIVGLAFGVQYDVRVYATNADGDGPPSAVEQIIVESVPNQVTGLSAAGGQVEQSNLSWTAPSSYPAINGYDCELKLSSSGTWLNFIGIDSGAVSQIIFALDNQSYDFRIAATNSRGTGAFSSQVSATPNAIGAPLAGLFDETNIDTTTPVTSWNNAGNKGGNWNLNQVIGNQNNLTAATRKGKPCLFTNGGAGLRTSVTSQVFQTYSIIVCLAPNNLTGTRKFLANDQTGGQSYQQLSNNQAVMNANSDLAINVSVPTSGAETIITSLFSAGVSNIRVTSNNGPTDVNITGDCGNNGFSLDAFLWNTGQWGDADFKGSVFELRIYDGFIQGADAAAVIGAMQQKWWNNYPYIEV